MTRGTVRSFSTRSPRAAAPPNDAAPTITAADSAAELPFDLPSPSSLPAGSFVPDYLAQAGQLSAMLDEIEARRMPQLEPKRG